MERNRISPILATKLYIPPASPNLVLRPRLIERLNRGLHRKLTLISAPAGFGKTTLVSEWAASCSRNRSEIRVAWVSLEEKDSEPGRFLSYVVAAIRTVAPEIGEGVREFLQTDPQQLIEPILNVLLNDITAVSGQITLVLEDYHVIDSRSIDEAITYMIEHMPPQLRLVITTREDPQLPLPRLRARDQLTELRVSEMRFTPDEAAGFLQAMGLHLTAKDIATLEERTEGWIAGLQLAALAMQSPSMQGRQELSDFIQTFAGNHRYIMDYLIEEVLQCQPGLLRSFLLQTSILDRLYGPLCDAVTGQEDGSTQLEALQRGNFFVIPLDDKRQWYRYHHLFAEVLHTYLLEEQPDQACTLHLRASVWYEQHGSADDAIRHALAAEDFARAAELIERVFPAMTRNRQEAILLGWLKLLPEALLCDRPVLCNLFAGALMQTGVIEGVDAWLLAAERWLSLMDAGSERPDALPPEMIVVDQEELRRLPGAVAMHRAGQALMLGNLDETILYARRVLDLAPEDDFLRRGGAAALLGLAYWTRGDLDAAHRLYTDGMARLQQAGHFSDVLGCTLALADMRIGQGRLRYAMRTFERGLRLSAEQGTPALVVRGTADMHVGMSELYREGNDLNTAIQHLQRSKELGEHIGLPQNPYRWCVAMARIRKVEGDLDGAFDLLNEAERLYVGDFSPNVRPIAAVRARLWVIQGRLGEAFDWVREQGLSAEDNLSYLHEFDHITLARLLLAQSKNDPNGQSMFETRRLLERLLQAAQDGGRLASEIEILLLQALALQIQGDICSALTQLERALTLAEPEGYIRLFLDEGSSMEQLLREATARRIVPGYTSKLLGAFKEEQHRSKGASPLPATQPLVEPLSQRELEVLRLFKTELSGPEIARELVVALSTVRTHTESIYLKLDVNNRRAAVQRAAEFGLI
jgi:LuxR family maltose regulon positive regulatory protein